MAYVCIIWLLSVIVTDTSYKYSILSEIILLILILISVIYNIVNVT